MLVLTWGRFLLVLQSTSEIWEGPMDVLQWRGEGNVWDRPIGKLSLINLLLIEKILSECCETSTKQVLYWLNTLYLFSGTTFLEHLLIFQKHDGNLLAALNCLQQGSSPFYFSVYFMTGLNLILMELGENTAKKLLSHMSASSWENPSTDEARRKFLSPHLSFCQNDVRMMREGSHLASGNTKPIDLGYELKTLNHNNTYVTECRNCLSLKGEHVSGKSTVMLVMWPQV